MTACLSVPKKCFKGCTTDVYVASCTLPCNDKHFTGYTVWQVGLPSANELGDTVGGSMTTQMAVELEVLMLC